MKKALTMIELIVVIVILGILSAGSMNIFMQVHGNYSSAVHITKLESKTSAVMDTISAKLKKRLHNSLRYRCDDTSTDSKYLRDVREGEAICGADEEPQVLEWVMNYDQKFLKITGTTATSHFCFSGITDMAKTLKNYTSTKIPEQHNIINIYDADEIAINGYCFSENESVGVYFLDTPYGGNFIEDMIISGTITKDKVGYIKIDKNDNASLKNVVISSAYQISKTAQAISLERKKDENGNILPPQLADPGDPSSAVTLYNMYLYYDYQPWKDKDNLKNLKNNDKAKKVLLAENITQFKTVEYDNFVGIDICMDDTSYKVKDKNNKTKFLRICKIGGAI